MWGGGKVSHVTRAEGTHLVNRNYLGGEKTKVKFSEFSEAIDRIPFNPPPKFKDADKSDPRPQIKTTVQRSSRCFIRVGRRARDFLQADGKLREFTQVSVTTTTTSVRYPEPPLVCTASICTSPLGDPSVFNSGVALRI
jgi:hypothetical protein